MIKIVTTHEVIGNFSDKADAERWLVKQGWEKELNQYRTEQGTWILRESGKIISKAMITSLPDFINKEYYQKKKR